MTQGLINTFEGRVGLCLAWLAFGAFATLVGLVVVFVRKAPPLTTQTNLETGVREHGVGRWLAVLAAFFMALPVLALVAVTSVELVHRLPVWVWPVGVAVAALIVGVVWLRSLPERHLPPPKVIPAQTPPVPPGWSMPERVEQWDK
jgi:hypothetical protein